MVKIIIRVALVLCIVGFFGFYFLRYILNSSRASGTKANIVVDTQQVAGVMNHNWKALAQGGEEKGVPMLGNVVTQVNELAPIYIRLDHIYDFYDVVSRNSTGQLVFNWTELDRTVCDIYATGAKPFFALGYMPPAISKDGSLISEPSNWEDWALVVQKTVEHYSGRSTILCGNITGDRLSDVYYEVWNEPDLEQFGKWSLYGGGKDYKTLYRYSVLGAGRAQNVNYYNIGGPAITAAYRNWFQVFLRYTKQNNLRIDFLSWHHYTPNPEDYSRDMQNLDEWLAGAEFDQYRHLPRIITEWGYDPQPNPIAETQLGAAHTILSIKNLIDHRLHLAFAFEVKDGPAPRWGMLSYTGEKKNRFHALKMLNSLDRTRLQVQGEGTYVQAIASASENRVTAILINFDKESRNNELVPVTFRNLTPGQYRVTVTNMYGNTGSNIVQVTDGTFQQSILMTPNLVVGMELVRQ